jgi:hypothetical protein
MATAAALLIRHVAMAIAALMAIFTDDDGHHSGCLDGHH